MATEKPKLPSWARWGEGDRPTVLLDVDEVYPMYLKLTGLKKDNFGVGVARMCATRDIADLCGFPIIIRFQPSSPEDKSAWSLAALAAPEEDGTVDLVKAEDDYDRGIKMAGRYRKEILANRAKAQLGNE